MYLHGTAVWDAATPAQRVLLDRIYRDAYAASLDSDRRWWAGVRGRLYEMLSASGALERWTANAMLRSTQRDLFHFSTALNGAFRYDPGLYPFTYRLLRGPGFGLSHVEAKVLMELSFCRDSDGLQAAWESRCHAVALLREYLAEQPHLDAGNRKLAILSRNSIERHLGVNRRALAAFFRRRESSHELIPAGPVFPWLTAPAATAAS